MNKKEITDLLKDFDQEHVERFAAYCMRLALEKKRDGSLKNPWMKSRNPQVLADLFKRVSKDGLVFDGVHVTLQNTGVSYDYIAYKNKMLIAYPESKVDVSLVYKGDEFSVSKDSGKVNYVHNVANPFAQKDSDIEGGYCVIRNKRGEFITLLSKEDIEKHRKVAKTDYIWKNWFKEMAMKTVIKKACKQHFADMYQEMEEMDNEQYDLELPVNIELTYKQEIEAIKTIDELKAYWQKNKGKGKDLAQLVKKRKEELTPKQS